MAKTAEEEREHRREYERARYQKLKTEMTEEQRAKKLERNRLNRSKRLEKMTEQERAEKREHDRLRNRKLRARKAVPKKKGPTPLELLQRENRQIETQERKTRGLIALAACAGNADQAAKYLKRTDSPVKVTAATLEKWREEMGDVYSRVADDYGAQLEQQLVVDHRETALKCMNVLDQALDRTMDRMQFLNAAESSKVALDMSKIVTTGTRDMLLLTGRATDISDNRGAVEIIGALMARFPRLFENLAAEDQGLKGSVEGTVEEESEVEVEPEGPLDLTQLPPPPQEPVPDVEEAF